MPVKRVELPVGVTTVGASEATKEIKVEFDPVLVTEQKIRLQLGRIGYPAA